MRQLLVTNNVLESLFPLRDILLYWSLCDPLVSQMGHCFSSVEAYIVDSGPGKNYTGRSLLAKKSSEFAFPLSVLTKASQLLHIPIYHRLPALEQRLEFELLCWAFHRFLP